MRVEEIAGGRTCALPGWLTCSHGWSIMHRLGIEAAPVVQDARVVGVALRRTLSVVDRNKPVRDALAPPPTACWEHQRMDEALALMQARALNDLPVLDRANRPVGTLRLQDVVLALARERAGRARPTSRRP